MVYNQPFQHQPSAIVSFDFTDISEGTGIVRYKGFISSTDGGNESRLSTVDLYSADIETSADLQGEGSFRKDIDLDFDLSAFNLVKTIRGTAIINATLQLHEVGAATIQGYIIARIKKNDVEIASGQSETIQTTTDVSKVMPILVSIPPKTQFKKGDVLRVTIEGWGKSTAGTAGDTITIGHDPQNRDGTRIKPSTDSPTTTTNIDFYIPFDLDL